MFPSILGIFFFCRNCLSVRKSDILDFSISHMSDSLSLKDIYGLVVNFSLIHHIVEFIPGPRWLSILG